MADPALGTGPQSVDWLTQLGHLPVLTALTLHGALHDFLL